MEIHHISEAGVSFEIQFGLWIKIWAGEHIFLHMAANYRLNQIFHVHTTSNFNRTYWIHVIIFLA